MTVILASPPRPRPLYVRPGRHVAVRLSETGTAILSYQRSPTDEIEIEAIERLPAGLDAAAAWLRATFPTLPHIAPAQVIIDAGGLGRALVDLLRVELRPGWKVYDRHGRDRQELVNALLVAVADGRLHIAPSAHADAMRKALATYRREVGEDGAIGGELVTALALATFGRVLHGPVRLW